MNQVTFVVGQHLRAKRNMINDLSDEGMGIQHCAEVGDRLVVRQIGSGYKNCIAVSHEGITDRCLCVAPEEIEPMDVGGAS